MIPQHWVAIDFLYTSHILNEQCQILLVWTTVASYPVSASRQLFPTQPAQWCQRDLSKTQYAHSIFVLDSFNGSIFVRIKPKLLSIYDLSPLFLSITMSWHSLTSALCSSHTELSVHLWTVGTLCSYFMFPWNMLPLLSHFLWEVHSLIQNVLHHVC